MSSVCFALQYLPQAWLNFRRKSVKGFSTHGIIIKLLGASFLLVNSYLNGETFPVIFYGLVNVVQHSVFIFQFFLYQQDGNFLHWLLFPTIPYLIGKFFPETIPFTNTIKPITQILSHLPQLKVCYDLKTTNGVSMLSQHFNIIGGLLGVYMCYIIPPVSQMTYLIYANSIFQALSLYTLALYYDFYLVSSHKVGIP
eukprot:Phypoly_transcript_19011.p1 GENE.Phypoly_transcript_19011~~Phypoly_transcript_19011.p1  ORF type:complete len:228 (+),score=6.77 Phypoly_transcript_19011:96-686(+)